MPLIFPQKVKSNSFACSSYQQAGQTMVNKGLKTHHGKK